MGYALSIYCDTIVSLTTLEKELVRVIRTMTWIQLDDLTDIIVDIIANANRSNIYRTLKAFDINRVPQEQKEKAKKFKEKERANSS